MPFFQEVAIRVGVLGLALTACGMAQEQPAPFAPEEGLASWYGPSFDGLRSASGEIFDSAQLTAAHRTLPFGTKVRVRRLDSHASIVVRINDRGPFVGSRIIDLSYAAARELGATDPGLFPVAVEIIDRHQPAAPASQFAVRLGTFRNPDNARRMHDRIQERLPNVIIQRTGEFWSVLAGTTASQQDAEVLAAKIREDDAEFRSAYVVKLGQ